MATDPSVKRRLAAILVADVVGYSRLMEADEAGTLAALRARREAVLQPVVKDHGGRIVKFLGDGVLVEFSSAVNAIAGALRLQKLMDEANEGLAETFRVVLRIGVNLGEVISQGSDIYGDGVNIAARLEPLARPGGLCISAKVLEEIRGKVDVEFEDIGEVPLKNIARPVRAYRDVQRQRPAPPSVDPLHNYIPSIAILPFANMSGDPLQVYFSDGITEDIITELSRFRQMHVVSRNSSGRFRGTDVDMIRAGRELGVQYLVEGSVRRIGARIRITAQLVDATTGNHIWAERYDSPQDEIFDVQDKVVRTIVGTLSGRMKAAGLELARRKPPANLAAYDCVLRGDALPLGTPEIEAEACLLFRNAIKLDPGYARAYALLSYAVEREWFRDMTGSDRLKDEAFEMAQRAVTLDENDAICQLSIAWAYVGRRVFELAEQHFSKALALNPNQPAVQADFAQFHLCLGEPDKAIEGLLEAKRLDPFFSPSWYWGEVGVAHFLAHRYEEAIASMRRAAVISTGQQAWLVASYALAGEPQLATECAADLVRRMAEFSIARTLTKQSFLHDEDLQHFADGLRKGGLPE